MINVLGNKKMKGDGMRTQIQITEEVIEALELLQKAAREETEEIKKIIRQNVNELAELLAEKKHQARESISKTKDELNQRVVDLDEQIHDNPWPYITAAAVGAFFIGMVMKNK